MARLGLPEGVMACGGAVCCVCRYKMLGVIVPVMCVGNHGRGEGARGGRNRGSERWLLIIEKEMVAVDQLRLSVRN